MCSSLGVSLTLVVYFVSSGISRSDLVPNINWYSQLLNNTSAYDSKVQLLAQLEQEVNRQSSMLGYDGAFLFLTLLSLIPIVVLSMTQKLLVGDQTHEKIELK